MPGHLRVVTHPGDIHAGAVAWALADRGIATRWMCLSDFPARATHSFELGEAADATAGSLPDADCDFVWIRRIGRSPGVPDGLDARDAEACRRESERFFWGLLHVLAPQAWWVNPLTSFMTSRHNKLHQLRLAQACGMTVPQTLASNDPARIGAFVRAHGGRVIAKPFFPHLWNTRDGRSYEYLSSLVTEQDLADPRVLQASPLIYQHFVDKAFEVRVAIFGQAVIAARLDTRGDPDLAVDWRHAAKHPTVTPFQLPDHVREGCLRVMAMLGLVHGSFDFIVRPDGGFVFLEVNESGQCLWMEEDCPDLPVLSALVGLFLARRPDFSDADLAQFPYRFAAFRGNPDYEAFLQGAAQDHLPVSMEGVVLQE